MEFDFSLSAIFPKSIMMIGKDIVPRLIDGNLNASSPGADFFKKTNCVHLDPSGRMCLGEVLDSMGARSAQAQHLMQALTSTDKLRSSQNHVVYIMTQCSRTESATDLESESAGRGTCVGFLKVGRRQLYIDEEAAQDSGDGQPQKRQKVVSPICVLDFYVHESLQRLGYGKQLYDAMLKNEHVRPEHVALDGPSSLLSSFLTRHYSLRHARAQHNNFVVYEGFFDNRQDDTLFSVAADRTANDRSANGRSTNGRSANGGTNVTDSSASSGHEQVQQKSCNTAAAASAATATAAGTVSSNVNMRNLHDHHKLW